MPQTLGKCQPCSLFFRPGIFCPHLEGGELCEIKKHSKYLRLKRGQTLGEEIIATFPILAISGGVIGIKHLLDDGRSTIAAFFMNGDVVDLRRRSNRMHGSLVALTKVDLCVLSFEVFEEIIATNPDAQRHAWENLREQTNRAMDHSADLGKKQALEKLASFVFECRKRQRGDNLPGQTVRIPIRRCDVAEYLGLQPETVSRGFSELQARNILKFHSPSIIEITCVADLKRIANGGQTGDGIVRRNGASEKVMNFQ